MNTKREKFLIGLIKYGNVPYIWGGSSIVKGLDCSGFTQLAMSEINLDPPGDQTADAFMKLLVSSQDYKSVEVSAAQADLGDVIFFGPSKSKATHIAIALGEGLMVEAGGGGSKTTTKAIAEKQGAKVRVTTINRRSDLICIRRPVGLPWFQNP